MPRKINRDAFFQVRLTDAEHKELEYIARKKHLLRYDGAPNKSAALRHTIAKEASYLRKRDK